MRFKKMNVWERFLLLLTKPKRFFKGMKKERFNTVLKYTLPVMLLVFLLDLLFYSFSPIEQAFKQGTVLSYIILSIAGLLVAYVVQPAFYNLFLLIFKKKPDFFKTWSIFLYMVYFSILTTLAYGLASILVMFWSNAIYQFIVIVVWTIVSIAMLIWWIYIVLAGVEKIHKISKGRAFLALLLSSLTIFLVLAILFVLV